jgi:hypothetical protein
MQKEKGEKENGLEKADSENRTGSPWNCCFVWNSAPFSGGNRLESRGGNRKKCGKCGNDRDRDIVR